MPPADARRMKLQGLSIREFARRDGCNDKLVRRKLKSGHLTAFADGSLDPALVGTDWRRRPRTPAEAADMSADTGGVSATPAEGDDDLPRSLGELAEAIIHDALGNGQPFLTKAAAERLKENYLALLRQLEYDTASGAVAEIEEFTSAVAAEYLLVKNRLLNIGSRVAPRCAVMKSAEEVKALIDREVALALEELTLDAGGRGGRADTD